MSNLDSTLSVLGLPYENIHVTAVFDGYRGRGNRHLKYHIIACDLTYHRDICPHCGENALRPNGHKATHIRIQSHSQLPTLLELSKQRWLCSACHRTCSAETPLVAYNDTIAHSIKQAVLQLARTSLPEVTIAKLTGISAATVRRELKAHLHHRSRPGLPTNLCFDEFRSTQNMMSFICIDGDTHQLVKLLGDRLNKTIKDFFLANYSAPERAAVQTITMDMNASYQIFIRQVFPNAQLIIDRFHIIQLLGHAVDTVRIATLKQLDDKKSRVYRILKHQWRLFHKTNPDASDFKYIRGLNEYITEQGALDVAFTANPRLAKVCETYQALHDALMGRNPRQLWHLLEHYEPTGTEMDTAIRTLKSNQAGILAAADSWRSNGPLEGINRKIKALKRSCYGFRDQAHFFERIYQIIA